MPLSVHLRRIKKLPNSEISARIKRLLAGSPFTTWPLGMPSSLDPKLVIIGVSPGNSPGTNVAADDYCSAPSKVISPKSNYFYPDSKSYWKKIRTMARGYFLRSDASISVEDALLATSHLNLGTGSAGTATKGDVDYAVIRWVSGLLNSLYKPDVVVLLGLKSIMDDGEVYAAWNHSNGLAINWRRPDLETPFTAYSKATYRFREWRVERPDSHRVRVIMWPNHPSRVPFSDMNMWEKSIEEFNRKI